MKTFLTAALVMALTFLRPGFSAEQTKVPGEPQAFVYREIGERKLRAYVFLPDSAGDKTASAILLFHGGGWSIGEPEWTFPSARRFASLGMVAISVEYRLSEGEITPIDALSDVCEAFCWARAQAREFSLDPARVAGYGVSAGGHLVACAATVGCPKDSVDGDCSKPNLLLLWSPAVSVASDGWFGKKLQGRAAPVDYSPVEHVNEATPPTCMVQGEKDTLTPLSGAKRYCDRLREAGVMCELNVYEGLGHLLTRNLANQESDFDPDPEARADGIEKQIRFLEQMGFIHRE